MSDVLVVQPDAAQAETLRGIFRRVGADVVLVDSTLAAMDAIAMRMPDLILLSALLSPRDEDALMAHLRTLEEASHLQTITIPQFRKPGAEPPPAKKSAFGFLKKQKAPAAAVGCDPAAFADEVIAHLSRAREIRNRPPAPARVRTAIEPAPEPVEPYVPAAATGDTTAATYDPPVYQPPIYEPEAEPTTEPFADDSKAHHSSPYDAPAEQAQTYEAPVYESPVYESPVYESPVYASPEAPPYQPPMDELVQAAEPARETTSPAAQHSSISDEVDRLVRQLGFNLKILDREESAPPLPVPADDGFDLGDSLDRARNEAENRRAREIGRAEIGLDAAAIREAAIAEARAAAEREAREAVAADLARVQAEAEAMRDRAIEEARAVAEREAREKLEAELARVRSETEATVADALNKVKVEAELAERLRTEEVERIRNERHEEAERLRSERNAEAERMRAEAERARVEAERLRNERNAEAERMRAEAERVRVEADRVRVEAQEAFAAELARVRREVEQSLAAQLDASRAEAERMRASDAAAMRERAAVETQLKAELERLKFVAAQARKADETETRKAADQIKHLEGELARVRQVGDERQAAQLEELRAQMAEMKEAAAQQARAAAAEAVASQVARAAKESHDTTVRTLNVIRMQPRAAQDEPAAYQSALESIETLERQAEAASESLPSAADYYKLFQPPEPAEEPVVEEPDVQAAPGIDYARHAKWAVPVAACLVLVANIGNPFATMARFVTPEEKPTLTVEPLEIDKPFIEVVEERVGSLKVDSTPAGAEVILDGKSYGPTPITIPDLAVGGHKLQLKGSTGTITRKVTIKANQTTILSEAIYSGWMAIFSPIPVQVVVDGQAVSLIDDSRVMATPGKHVVEFISEKFNYRSTETIDVRPGETTAHTVTLPMGTLRITAPEGAEIRVDGQPPSGSPAQGLEVSIGAHEVSAVHPERGERRVSVDVKHGSPTDVVLAYE